ncbi:MAG: methylated-DNA--[protein]-cysteine S-methyltransferase [Bacteroidales bacterium]|nr:methylated-DNA--[protein]-cysteine S-methyltransferase [Bacteroidales bacterium]
MRLIYHSPIGDIALDSDGSALTGLRFADNQGVADFAEAPVFEAAVRWLDRYFAGGIPDFEPPLRMIGTPFQQSVWRELMTIPYGQTATYGDIARRIGCRSAQAVGGAVGRNPIAIIVPCHRVVGADGSLTGYAYGLEIKQQLLQLEHNHRL